MNSKNYKTLINLAMDFCLSYLNNKVLKGFGKGTMNGITLIYLQQAFCTIDYDVLLQKLYAI